MAEVGAASIVLRSCTDRQAAHRPGLQVTPPPARRKGCALVGGAQRDVAPEGRDRDPCCPRARAWPALAGGVYGAGGGGHGGRRGPEATPGARAGRGDYRPSVRDAFHLARGRTSRPRRCATTARPPAA
ncbi:hypothetical protein QJS66_23660 (plasmid) [Kocuria rhizophila]|nr:hypothetical protein QJS66_23660 [Kocuria rhizophila]